MSSIRERERSRRAARLLGLTIVVLGLVAVIVLSLVIYRVARSFSGGEADIEVPAIVGMKVEEAEETLNRLNLGMRVSESVYSQEVAAGFVVKQNPVSGFRVREGRVVRVIRSLGPPSLRVPDVVGKELLQAQRAIARAGFVVGAVRKVFTRKLRKGRVITQEPAPDKVFTAPVKVDLTVADADASSTVSMPDLRGQQLYVAERQLQRANLALAGVSYVSSELAEGGTVLEQSPQPGETVALTDQVRLRVAMGREMASALARTFQVRFRLPLTLPGGELSIEIIDALGSQVIYGDKIEPGEVVEQSISAEGSAKVRVLLDGRLIREDTI